jgi:hypothetical protein
MKVWYLTSFIYATSPLIFNLVTHFIVLFLIMMQGDYLGVFEFGIIIKKYTFRKNKHYLIYFWYVTEILDYFAWTY